MARLIDRRRFLGALGAVSLAGCLGNDPAAEPTREPTASPASESDATTVRPSDTARQSPEDAGPPIAEYTLPLPMSGEALQGEARSGGPPRDGIPSIDEPAFVSASAADDRLDDGDIVFGAARGGEAKAYPQRILVWHEIVNDALDGDSVSVSYCPLTGTVQGFPRGATTFGVSGRLLNNNLIMYDRATENWWPQVLATAIPGPWSSTLAGRSLPEFRVVWTTWGRWKAKHPGTQVLSEETGYARNYDRDPYGQYNPKGGYYSGDSTLFPRLNEDDRFAPKDVVMGVRSPEGAAAVSKPVIREQGLVEGAIGGTPLLWAYDADLDTAYAYWNPDGRDFTARDGAVAGPDGTHEPADLPLDRALTFDAMWFAWSGFYPETSVHG
jgi:hypothetical protein